MVHRTTRPVARRWSGGAASRRIAIRRAIAVGAAITIGGAVVISAVGIGDDRMLVVTCATSDGQSRHRQNQESLHALFLAAAVP